MEKFWSSMAVNLGRRATVVAVVIVGLTLVFGAGLPRLEFATGQDSYLNEDSEVYVDNVAYQDLFGGQAMLSLFTMDEGADLVDLFTERNIAQMREVEAQLLPECQLHGLHPDQPELSDDTECGRHTEGSAPGVLTAVSPLTALLFTEAIITTTPDGEPTAEPTASVAGRILLDAGARDPDEESAATRTEDSLATLERLNAIPEDERTVENPEWVEFLLYDNRGDVRRALQPFFPDPRNAQFVTRLDGNLGIEEEGDAAAEVEAAFAGYEWDNATVTTTGAPVLLRDLNDYLRGGFLTLGAIAAVLMMFILLLTFRVRWRLLPLGIILVGVVWAFGLAGYLGIPLSVVTISGLPVLLGIGIDFAIQMHSRVEEEVQLDRAPHPIQETTRNLAPALIIATLAAAIAFLALLLSEVPMIRHFGVLLALGIVVVLVVDVVLSTTVLGAREYRSPTTPRDYTRDPLSRLVVKLGSLPMAAVPVLVLGSLLVFIGGVAIEDSLELQTDPEQWVNQDTQVIADIETVRVETGASAELGIFVEAEEIFSDTAVGFIHDFALEQLERYPDDLLTASSVVTTASFLMEIPDTTQLAPTGQDVAEVYSVAPVPVRLSTVNPEENSLNIIFRTGPAPLEDRAVYVNEIRDSVSPPEGVRATPSGLAVVGVGLFENLQANRILLTYVALGAVFVFLSLRLLSPIRGLLAMIPVMMGVGAAALVAFAAGFKLSPLTALSGPLVIAACAEFTSLILTRYMEERRRGLAPEEATEVASSRTGRAFVASALATVAGVGVLAMSGLPLLRDFGFIVTINVTVALLSALVVLPPLIIWADKRGWVLKESEIGSTAHDAASAPAPAS